MLPVQSRSAAIRLASCFDLNNEHWQHIVPRVRCAHKAILFTIGLTVLSIILTLTQRTWAYIMDVCTHNDPLLRATPFSSMPNTSTPRVQADNLLGTGRLIAQLAKDVTDIANVPFASQAASLVLSLLEVAKVSRKHLKFEFV